MLTVFLASLAGVIYGVIKRPGLSGSKAIDEEEALSAAATAQAPPPISAKEEPVSAPNDGRKDAGEEDDVEDDEPPASLGKVRLPFGTFLAAAAVFTLVRGDELILWYQSLFRP